MIHVRKFTEFTDFVTKIKIYEMRFEIINLVKITFVKFTVTLTETFIIISNFK